MTYTEKVVDYIVNFKKESIPKDVIEHAKIFVLDTIGCALGGDCTKAGKEIASQAKEFSGAAIINVIESAMAMITSHSLAIQPLTTPMEQTIRPNSL